MRKVIIGIPAYNEEAALPKLLDKFILLEEVFGNSLRIVVVNDGSSDQTASILEEYSDHHYFIHYIHHSQNRGLGAAMSTLFNHLLENYNDQDIAVTLDADNTHNPKIIPTLVSKLENEKLDVVIASRFTEGGEEIGLSFIRKVYSRGAKLFFKLFFPIPNVNDYSCGFRAYRIGYLRKAFDYYDGKMITSNGFECMVEILARFSKIGVKAGESPLVLEYNLKETPSKMNVTKTISGYFRLLKKVKRPALPSHERNQYE